MRKYQIYRRLVGFLAVAALLAAARSAPAQYPGAPGLGGSSFGGNQAVLGEGDRVPKMEAGFTKPAADGTAQLYIVANMPEGAHTYSITQPDGGPIRTKIKVDTSAAVPSIGKFLTATKPKINHMEDAFPGVPLEEQSGKVKWFVPIKLAAGTKPDAVKIEGKVVMQLCDDNGCVMPKDYAFTATYQPDAVAEKDPPPSASPVPKKPATPAATPATPGPSPVKPIGPTGYIPRVGSVLAGIKQPSSRGFLSGGGRLAKVEAGFTAPASDGSAQLFITAALPSGVNTYSLTQRTGPVATKIQVDAGADFSLAGKFASVPAPEIVLNNPGFPGVPLEEHLGTVKWIAPIKLAPGARPESVKIAGKVVMQLCEEETGCLPPTEYPFEAGFRPDVQAVVPAGSHGGDQTGTEAAAVGAAAPAPPPSTASGGEIHWLPFIDAADLRQIVNPEKFNVDSVQEEAIKEVSAAGMLVSILKGFLGGLILNIMPCVLPVMGLKILSFVQQSGHNRGRAFMLNVCYSLGLLAVFLGLAVLAILFHFGWGELFGFTWFKIGLAAIVFVMALSFMGVWEVPLPTFLGGGKAGALAAQEGATGAFFKGVLTTFLATPCMAPGLAPAVAWAMSQPALVTICVFVSAALGMASPYLLIGAFPELIRFVPKPGDWMVTFKQFMGFVLMGTVVYLLYVLAPHLVVPTVGLLFSLSLTCWMVGRIGPERELGVKVRTWALGAAIVGIAWIVMFPGLDERVLGPYHFSGLAKATAPKEMPVFADQSKSAVPRIAGPKPVLVDFTASWCPNCHLYENTVLKTRPVVEAVRKGGVVPLKADWSEGDPKVSAMLDVLASKFIPVIAIFSPRDPNHPRVFRGSYTQKDILDALEWAAEPPRAEIASR